MDRKNRALVGLLVAVSAAGGTWKPPALAAGAAAFAPEPATAAGAETSALTLERAIRLALAHNPELRAAAGRMEAAAGRAVQAGLWPNPELELATEDGPTRAGSLVADAKQTVGVAQTLPFPGKKPLDRAVGRAGVRVSEAELDLRRRELVREVKLAFFQALAVEQMVEVARELVRVAEASASAARHRVEAGAAADQERLRAEISLEQARAELVDFEREVITARQALVTLLGRPDLKDVPVVGALAETVDPGLLDQGPEGRLAMHPGVVAARVSRERAELELRRARLEPYPDVKLGVAGGREGGADGSSIVEFRVSLPLPIIDRSRGRQREARANVAIAEADSRAIEQRLWGRWNAARQRLRAAAEHVAASRERVLPKAEEALRLVQRGFEEGKFGLTDLLDTQRTAAAARLTHVQRLLELNSARAELESLLEATPPDATPLFTDSK